MRVTCAFAMMTCTLIAGEKPAKWIASGWGRYADAANWAEGCAPKPDGQVAPGHKRFDLGGGKAAFSSIRPDGWDGLYDFGVTNGELSITKEYISRSNLFTVWNGGSVTFPKGSRWIGGSNMGYDRWEKVSVRNGGSMRILGEFVPWHATIEIAEGGMLTLDPTSASSGGSYFKSEIANRGTLSLPHGLAWKPSEKAGYAFVIRQESGVMKLGGRCCAIPSSGVGARAKTSFEFAGGRLEVTGHGGFIGFSSCTVKAGAKVELHVAEKGSFDLSNFKFGKKAKMVKTGSGTVVCGGGAPPDGLVVEEGGLSYVPVDPAMQKPQSVEEEITRPSDRKYRYEPRTPTLVRDDNGVVKGLTPGFHGRAVDLIRITDANAIGDESNRLWRAVAWRNEYVHGQFVVWTHMPARCLRTSVSPLTGADGAQLPPESVSTRFVRYVVGHAEYKGEISQAERLFGDCLDDVDGLDLPELGYRPIWLTVRVPADARPGVYRGTLRATVNAKDTIEFPLELKVGARVLPPPSEWKMFVDFWQHPWAVARYHGVKPFSKLHYAFMEQYLKALAALGQKTITATVVHRAWNQGNNYEGFDSMVEAIRARDGSWRFDYSTFDEYVAFAKECGLGPQIHCYTLAGFKSLYTDEATGEKLVALEGSKRKDFWRVFLSDFEAHVKARGWLGDVYLALDESSPEVLKASVDLLREAAPGLKVAMAGERRPSEYAGVEVENFSEVLGHVTPEYIAEAKSRKGKGYTTSFYICCGPGFPNTFLSSPLCESVWQGIYAAGTGLDGILRWAAFTWPRDPLFDGSFIHWSPGDTYIIYPGPRLSTRYEMLRDGFEICEKIRILREDGALAPEVERLLDPNTYGRTRQFFAERTAAVTAAIDAIP